MELTTFNKAIEGTKKKSNDAKVLGSKRKHVPKRSWSPSNSTSPKKSKKMDTKMEKKSGRNKDLLKPKPAKKLIDSSPSSSDSSHISESDGDEKTSTTPPQCIISPTKDLKRISSGKLQYWRQKKQKKRKPNRNLVN
ncbi:uncharacterized protein LOC123265222 [Cotesia glomerata]|uniref:uncharacterized protein LOC123265222 n=1 Tax=Cotesia glomerata TaxID=32391 RepID=UPI001D004B33|nr:uncharacterized protein LOC123265222 [Cotesia glomerata]